MNDFLLGVASFLLVLIPLVVIHEFWALYRRQIVRHYLSWNLGSDSRRAR